MELLDLKLRIFLKMFCCNGHCEIRTHDFLKSNRFQDERLKPDSTKYPYISPFIFYILYFIFYILYFIFYIFFFIYFFFYLLIFFFLFIIFYLFFYFIYLFNIF